MGFCLGDSVLNGKSSRAKLPSKNKIKGSYDYDKEKQKRLGISPKEICGRVWGDLIVGGGHNFCQALFSEKFIFRDKTFFIWMCSIFILCVKLLCNIKHVLYFSI